MLAATQIISTTKVGRANITFFGISGYIWVRGVCHRDEWWTVRAIDGSREQQPAVGAAALAGASFFRLRVRGTTTAIFVNKMALEIYW